MAKKTKNLIIPLLLLAVATLLYSYYLLYADFSLTVLTFAHPKTAFKKVSFDKEILRGQSVIGEITAKENNLGIIGVRFKTFARSNDDILQFRLLEKGKNTPIVDAPYRTTLSDNELYNFGLPAIDTSAGKTYVFSITSTKGQPGNAVAISSTEPTLVSKYKFPKAQLLHSPVTLARFLGTKISQTLFTPQALYMALALYLPVFAAVVRKRKVVYAAMAIIIALDIFFFTSQPALLIGAMALSWIVSTDTRKRAMWSLQLASVLMVLMTLLLAVQQLDKAQKAGAWAFVFFAIMVGQLFVALQKKQK